MRVVLILADAMRADHMSCMGYDKETTPNLDFMASRGIFFKEARSEFSFTGPSIASLLTSNRTNGTVNQRTVPTSDFVMLSEVVPTFLVTSHNLFQIEGWRKGFKEIDLFLGKTCADVTTRLLEHIESHKDGLFMAHFLDTHVPYRAGPYRNEFDMKAYPQKELPVQEVFYGIYRNCLRQFRYDFEVPKHLMCNLGFHMAQYDGAIRAIDSQVERVRKHLAARDVLIFLSDHGELFGEHGYYCNHPESVFYKELLHVPLLLYSGRPFVPTAVLEEVSLLDVAPTVCDLMQVPVPETFEGRSLLPFCREAEIDPVVLDRLRKLGY